MHRKAPYTRAIATIRPIHNPMNIDEVSVTRRRKMNSTARAARIRAMCSALRGPALIFMLAKTLRAMITAAAMPQNDPNQARKPESKALALALKPKALTRYHGRNRLMMSRIPAPRTIFCPNLSLLRSLLTSFVDASYGGILADPASPCATRRRPRSTGLRPQVRGGAPPPADRKSTRL